MWPVHDSWRHDHGAGNAAKVVRSEEAMRNTELEKLDGLVGEWTTTMSDAWFLEPPGVEVPGTTTVARLGGRSWSCDRGSATARTTPR
jgi:hypothetical protein